MLFFMESKRVEFIEASSLFFKRSYRNNIEGNLDFLRQ